MDKTAPARKHTSRLTQSVLRRLASRATGLATRTHAECTHAECTQVDALKKEAKPYDNAAANFGSLKHGVNTRASAARTQHSRDRNRSPLPITAIARRCRSPLPLAAAAHRYRSPLAGKRITFFMPFDAKPRTITEEAVLVGVRCARSALSL
jgi:hypothetical protein